VSPLPRYELTGPDDAPLVIVLGGISASRHITPTESDGAAGWWQDSVGPAKGIDTTRYRILGIDYLDGGRGPDGRPVRIVTTHDQGDALAELHTSLGLPRAHAVVGASYGGMVTLAFAERHADLVGRIIVIGAAHESHPMSTGLRAFQRRIVELGLETGRATDGMILARAIAMTTYRTAREFGERFRDSVAESRDGRLVFPVESYLEAAGQRFAAWCPPERLLALSMSSDLHRVDPSAVRVPAVLIAEEGDTLVPEEQMVELSERLGAPNTLIRLATKHGHDAFLTDSVTINPILAAALSAPTGGVAA
jgi:homoserine O-acetyltransferase/O-succinyltransferase